MRIFIADFETTPFEPLAKSNYYIIPRFLCSKLVYSTRYRNPNRKRWQYFNLEKKGTKSLFNYIMFNCSLSNPSIFYFHNLHFDLAMIYKMLPKQYSYQIIRNSSKILSLRVFKKYIKYNKKGKPKEYKKTLFELRDSLVLLVSCADKIGKSLGFKKMEIDYKMKTITKEYIYYCRRDIRIIEKAIKKLLSFIDIFYNYELKISDLPLTLPSLSKRVFHKLLYNKGINEIKGKKIYDLLYDNTSRGNQYEKILRPYYYGGRVEVFNLNLCKRGYYNDFNSHYPAIMLENKFPLQPYSREKCFESEKCWKHWKNDKNIFGIECELNEIINEIPLIAMSCTTIYLKRIISSFTPFHLVLYSTFFSVPLFLLGALLWDKAMVFRLDTTVICSLLYQSLITASFGFVAWNTMLKKYGAVSLHSFMFIMPIAGVALGGLMLGEPISLKILLSLAFIVFGILVVNWHPKREASAYPIRRGI